MNAAVRRWKRWRARRALLVANLCEQGFHEVVGWPTFGGPTVVCINCGKTLQTPGHRA